MDEGAPFMMSLPNMAENEVYNFYIDVALFWDEKVRTSKDARYINQFIHWRSTGESNGTKD
jgi:hypothetical protein